MKEKKNYRLGFFFLSHQNNPPYKLTRSAEKHDSIVESEGPSLASSLFGGRLSTIFLLYLLPWNSQSVRAVRKVETFLVYSSLKG